MSFAEQLRSRSNAYNVKKDNVAPYSNEELQLVVEQAVMVCDSCAARGIYRCQFTPYLSNRVTHPYSPEFAERMLRDGIKVKWNEDNYTLDWSTDDETDLTKLYTKLRIADNDDDVDDK